jgi:crotonobetainyl-CoA:carnitine CoA-transferase CaiB-like acyl-CoA transferase
MSSQPLPLTGVRVLDLSRLLPGPFCSQILADFGAEVLKIEDPMAGDYIRWMPPMLDENSAFFYGVNRNKKSLKLNLKKEEGRKIFCKLLPEYDVVLESFRPGVMDKLGLGYETLKTINPRLIYCAITGYGQTGPYKNFAGHDLNFLNFAGISSLIGPKDNTPCIPGIQIADIGGGALWGVISILLALKAREVTGEGQMCDVSMLDGVFSWLAFSLPIFSTDGQVPVRGEGILNDGYACYHIYPTRDQKYVAIGAFEEKFWAEFCRRLDREAYIPNHLDPGSQETMIEDLNTLFQEKDQEHWIAVFRDTDICFSPVLSFAEALDDPQILARDMLIKTQWQGKSLFLPGIPVKLSATPGEAKVEFANHGEQTQEILRHLGYGAEEIQALGEDGVV